MDRTISGILVLLLGLTVEAGHKAPDKPAAPAEQYQALYKDYRDAADAYYLKTENEEEGAEYLASLEKLLPQFLELAEKNPDDPIALEALVQVVSQEMWFEINTSHPGFGKNSPATRAIAILLRDHVRSDKLSEACRRIHYGFRKDCETFLRAVLEKNPNKDIRAQACLRLAQFLNARLERLDLIQERRSEERRVGKECRL